MKCERKSAGGFLGKAFFKKKNKDTEENLISLFPLDFAIPSYDIYNCSSCLATKREANKDKDKDRRGERNKTPNSRYCAAD